MAKTNKRNPRIDTLRRALEGAMEHQRDLNSGNFLLNAYLQDGTLANISEKGKKVAESLKKEYLAASGNTFEVAHLAYSTDSDKIEAPLNLNAPVPNK